MFKKTRRKIVAAIMVIIILLLAGTLVVIYTSSYFEVSNKNREMLERYVNLFSLEEQPGENTVPIDKYGPDKSEKKFEHTPIFQLSTFYSVAISKDGEVLAIDNDGETIYTDQELVTMANTINKESKQKGIKKNLIYYMEDKGEYNLIAFMDNTVMQGTIITLFRYTLIFGSLVIALFFFLARYFAKKIIEPIEESYKKQKQFISDAGHELKTPISVISANAEVLSREIGYNQWLNNIQYENKRMGILVGQLLELARTENVKIQMSMINLSHLVSGEVLPFECVAFENGVSLNCEIKNDIQIYGNPEQLKQVTSILLDNAICHCIKGKQITIMLKEERHHAVLAVVNDGEEIPQNKQKQIFERFYRMDVARNSEDKRYGLGLAIAKSIVSNHKGKISVQCNNGKVEFKIILPIQK